LVWCFSAANLLAQADPLELIPDDALGFAVIKNLSDANERVGKVAQKMQLPVPDVLTLVKGFAGVQDGLDENGGLAVCLASGGEGQEWADSSLVAIVPVTDYQQLIATLQPEDADAPITSVTLMGQKMLVGKKGSFAVFAYGEDEEKLEKFLGAKANVTAAIEPLAGWMADKQLALVVTPAGKKVLFETIAAAIPDKEQLKKDAQGSDVELEPQALALANVGEMFGVFKELLVAADGQVTHLAVGLRIEDNASLRLAVRVLFTEGGKLAAWSKDMKAPPEGLLAGVPGGKFALAYGGVSAHFSPEMQAVITRFSEMGMQMIGMDEADRREFAEVTLKLQKGKRFTGGMMSMMRPGDSLFSTALTVEHVDSADEQLKIMRQMFKLMQGAQKKTQADEPFYEFNEVKVGELDALELVTSLGAITQLGAGNGAGPAQAQQVQGLLGKLFGADGKIRMYVTKADEKTVVSAYDKEQLVRGVDHVRAGGEGLEADADIAKTTALLPPGAQWVAYVSPQGLVQWIGVFVESLFGGEVHLPPFPATEPIGLAAKVSASGLDAELVVPDSVVAGIGQYIAAIGQMFQDGGPPLP
jgi:hypothetical protein